MTNIPDSITIYAPHSDSDWNRSGTRIVSFTRWSWESYQLQRSYPLPLPGWSLAIYYGGTWVDENAHYVAASVSPSGTICTLVRWVSEDYAVADYLQDAHDTAVTCYTGDLTGISPIPSAPELRVVDSRWSSHDVEAYGDYLASFGIDCAYPADESYRDHFITFSDTFGDGCLDLDDLDEAELLELEDAVFDVNAAIRDWIDLIMEAAPHQENKEDA